MTIENLAGWIGTPRIQIRSYLWKTKSVEDSLNHSKGYNSNQFYSLVIPFSCIRVPIDLVGFRRHNSLQAVKCYL